MQLGAIFPNDVVGSDPGAVRAFAQALEDMGFDYLATYDHVLGASAAHYDSKVLPGPYRETNLFNEPFVLFGYLAGVTKTLGFATTILILAQRQTVLVAKQAAQVDVLTGGGRLRLGIGTGWNTVEYEALNMPWSKRGRMIEEQIKVLRMLWTQEIVDFQGEFHTIRHAGLNPMPVQRPIPIWLGGISDAVINRIGRIGDGWMPQFRVDEPGSNLTMRPVIDPAASVEKMRQAARDAGRDPAAIGIDARIVYAGSPDDWRGRLERYLALGATHIALSTMLGDVADNADAHIKALGEMKAAMGL